MKDSLEKLHSLSLEMYELNAKKICTIISFSQLYFKNYFTFSDNKNEQEIGKEKNEIKKELDEMFEKVKAVVYHSIADFNENFVIREEIVSNLQYKVIFY